jgi:hypothetical protein
MTDIDIDAVILERLRARDQMLFSLSDILDAKAGAALVVITFLASQSKDILTGSRTLPSPLFVFQLASVALLALGAIAAVAALWPREHGAENASDLEQWAADLRSHYDGSTDPEADARKDFKAGLLVRLKETIAQNAEVTENKSALLARSYKMAGAALLLNIFTIVGLAFT